MFDSRQFFLNINYINLYAIIADCFVVKQYVCYYGVLENVFNLTKLKY